MGTETLGHPARGQIRGWGWGGDDTHGSPWGACLFERKKIYLVKRYFTLLQGRGGGWVVGTGDLDVLLLT